MARSIPTIETSPTSSYASLSSNQSYEFVSARSRSPSLIIWPLSASANTASTRFASGQLVRVPNSPNRPESAVSSPTAPKSTPRLPASTPTSASATPKSSKKKHKKNKQKEASKKAPIQSSETGQMSIVVDDLSEAEVERTDSVYREAVQYISSFLSNPGIADKANKLRFFQALIIELGLSTVTLPSSLKQATNFIKTNVFLNIHEYLAVREQGLTAIRSIMHPTRSSLTKAIRKRRNHTPLRWVKASAPALSVFLVRSYF
ncbi:hypothetical protein DL96DRAFT_1577485 [Flagelloscypha sp. PMI_526]|nr:hypothetical protein DL96DRAFT_1577485 [Flagelloscypha sp. PMI_526]